MKNLRTAIFSTVMLLAVISQAQSRKVYGDKILVDEFPVRTVLKLMSRDTMGAGVDQTLINAESQCQIYVEDLRRKGFKVYSFTPYATPTASVLWHGNCEATLDK